MRQLNTKAELVAHYDAVRVRLGKPTLFPQQAVIIRPAPKPAPEPVIALPPPPPPPPLTVADKIRLAVRLFEEMKARQPVVAPLKTLRAAVAEVWGIEVQDIAGASLLQRYTHPRMICMALADRLTGKGPMEIGRVIAGRDHCTAKHAINKFGPVVDAALKEQP